MTSPYRRFASRLAWEWGDADTRWRQVDGTLLFVDISGFTALSERLAARGRIGAEELTQVLSRVFGKMLDAAHGRGGSLLKFGGDALLLLFDSEDHAMQATASAVEMRAALRQAAEEPTSVGRISLRMSSGIHSGPIDLFLVGDSHKELIIGGPTASMTTVMEADASPGEIVVSRETAARLPTGFVGSEKGAGLLLRKRRIHHPKPAFDSSGSGDGLDEDLIPVGLRQAIRSGASDSEHRVATVAFLGFAGLDGLLAKSGEKAAAALDELVSAVQSAVDKEGVTFLASDVAQDGGKIILTSGVPVNRGDAEGRILRASRQILDSDQELRVRIGLNRGHVFSGSVGDRRSTYTVMGDTVNLAARLMTAAPYGSLYSSPGVLDRASTLFKTTPLERFEVKGKAAAVEAYEVGDETGSRPVEATTELSFTGREEALERLATGLATPGSTVTIIGESGIGKTRLVAEAIAADPDTAIFSAFGEPARSESPYWAMRDSTRELLGIEPGYQPEMRAQLEKAIEQMAPDLAGYIPLIADVTQIDIEDTQETADLDTRFRPTKTTEVLVSLLERLIPDRLAIIAEDAQWMDDLSLGLIESLTDAAKERHWSVVITSRDGESGSDFGGDVITLEPLSEESVRSIAIAATEAAPLRPHELDAIVARAGGNPLFLGEILQVVRETGDASELPESLDTVVSAEIDTLPPLPRRLLRYGAVLGRSFATIIFDRLLESEGVELDDATWSYLSRFLERQAGSRFHFKLSMVHSAAYQGLSYRRRKELHARAGETIEELAGDDTDSAADVLAYHYSNSGDHEKAWRYARAAAARAKSTYANAQAADHYQSAIEAARNLGEIEPAVLAETWKDLGDVLALSGEYEAARSAFGHALKAPGLAPEMAVDLYLARAQSWWSSGRDSEALRNLTLARKQLNGRDDLGAQKARARLDAHEAGLQAEKGNWARADQAARSAIDRAIAAGEDSALAYAYNVLDGVNFWTGVEETRHGDEVIDLYESIGQLDRAVSATVNMGAYAYLEGNWHEAARWYEKSIATAKRTGNVDGAADSMSNLAELLISQRRFDDALPLVEESLRLLRASNYLQSMPFVRLQEARAAIGKGDPNRALAILEPMFVEQIQAGVEDHATAIHIAEALVIADRPAEALEAIDRLRIENEASLVEVSPSIARVRGLALQAADNSEAAHRYFELAVEQARAQGDIFEEALALEAACQDDERRSTLFESLGIAR